MSPATLFDGRFQAVPEVEVKARLAFVLLFVVLLFVAASAAYLAAQEKAAPQNASIRKQDLKADVYFLADDLTRGRLVGTPEYALAAEFVKSRFERLGLTPAGPNGTYFHPFNLMVATLGGENANTLDIAEGSGGASTLRARLGQDFYPHRFSATGTARGGVVFAGFGITAPALSWDDYAGEAVKGKIVLILDHEPGERDPASPFDGVVTAEPAVPFRKVLAAQAKGAIGVLFVSDVHNHANMMPGVQNFQAASEFYWPAKPPLIDRFFLADYLEKIRIPAVQISSAMAEALLRGTNRTLADLAKAAEGGAGTSKAAAPVPLTGAEISLTVDVRRHIVPDRTIVGLIEGSDPQLKNEVVIVSAHHDHQGADGDQIFNGADDNVSGTAAVIDIAEAYALAAQEGVRPKRSILFAVFGSEERGPLLGSWAYTERPLRPLDKTVAVLNMDMIGRNMEVPIGGGARFAGLTVQSAESNTNSVNIIGHSRHPALKTAVEQANQAYGLTLKMDLDNNSSNLLRRSDQWPFLQRGVPAVWFHTGLHPDYHTVNDRAERLNYDKMEKIARLVHQVSWNLANAAQAPPHTSAAAR
jgi:Zn-dependent M28 family amino/carboxypeptidase